jgi:antitoxin component YwqK of YwqJK toxin-antitoxin module
MRYLILGIFVWACQGVTGQNLLDEQGRKTGPWTVTYPSGKKRYEATFSEGKPVGEMVRYYENGAVQARMLFDPETDRSFATFFYENGRKAAEGTYVNQEKDSVWTYYSEFDGTIRIREPYQQGKLEGTVSNYYPDGAVSEEVHWKNHQREGAWKQYYTDGSLRLESKYENDSLNGPYRVYYPNSTLEVSGTYLNNRSHGTWDFYDESGSVAYSIRYEHGLPLDQEKYLQLMNDSLERFQNLPDPGFNQEEVELY